LSKFEKCEEEKNLFGLWRGNGLRMTVCKKKECIVVFLAAEEKSFR